MTDKCAYTAAEVEEVLHSPAAAAAEEERHIEWEEGRPYLRGESRGSAVRYSE